MYTKTKSVLTLKRLIKFQIISIISSTLLLINLSQSAAAQATPKTYDDKNMVHSASSSLQAIYNCANIRDDSSRLACFDSAVGVMKMKTEQNNVIFVDREQVEAVQRDAFGFNLPSIPVLGTIFGSTGDKGRKDTRTSAEKSASISPDSVVLTLDHASDLPNGRLRFVFTNGQVWDQAETLRFSAPKKSDGPVNATIRKAALGSYLMKLDGKGVSIRVTRVE